jgi:hypothetical protein
MEICPFAGLIGQPLANFPKISQCPAQCEARFGLYLARKLQIIGSVFQICSIICIRVAMSIFSLLLLDVEESLRQSCVDYTLYCELSFCYLI